MCGDVEKNPGPYIAGIVQASFSQGQKKMEWFEGFNVLVLVCTVCAFHLFSLFLSGHQST